MGPTRVPIALAIVGTAAVCIALVTVIGLGTLITMAFTAGLIYGVIAVGGLVVFIIFGWAVATLLASL